MKVLYVVGTNLSRNTSANISHNAYIQGLLENGCMVDILMSSSSWGEKDDTLPVWKEANYYTFNSVSLIDRLKLFIKKVLDKNVSNKSIVGNSSASNSEKIEQKNNLIKGFRNFIKITYEFFFNTSDIYFLDRTWLKNAVKFKELSPYDLIISNSSPASSHRLVLNLLNKNRVTKTRWIQIWEDPWFYDIYGNHVEKVKREEHLLLKAAEEIFYVSNLTLYYQKNHFPDCAHKMKHIPLPYLKIDEDTPRENIGKTRFGYFGDYYSKTRNLQPFYDALIDTDSAAFINGDSDITLKSTESIYVNKRVTLDKLKELQKQTDVLVHLCNLNGGQIPGKIYHYSATTKPILFILDGTAFEKQMIKEYFMKFDRYQFCENNKEDILRGIDVFVSDIGTFEKKPVIDFSPKNVISEILHN